MSKILITGSSGFIGKALIDSLGDNQTIGLQRSESSNRNIIKCDLVNIKKVENTVQHLEEYSFTHLIHTAAITPWSKNPDYSDDIQMAESVALLCNTLQIPNLIVISGWNVYDMKGVSPFSEETPINPTTDYGLSKQTVEDTIAKNINKSNVVYIRSASVYGVGQTSPGLIPNLVTSAFSSQVINLNSIHTRRDYIYIDDFVDTIKKLTNPEHSKLNGAINVGSGFSQSVLQIAKTIQDIFKEEYNTDIKIQKNEPLKEDILNDNQLAITKAQEFKLLLKQRTMKQGLSEYIQWRKNENIL